MKEDYSSCPPGSKVPYYLKITKAKSAGYVAQGIEYLPSKHELLSSNTCTTTNNKIE
jgi:hypothetical protein